MPVDLCSVPTAHVSVLDPLAVEKGEASTVEPSGAIESLSKSQKYPTGASLTHR